MIVVSVETDGFPIDELLDQDFVGRLGVHFGEVDAVLIEGGLEYLEVSFLFQEKQLFRENFFEGVGCHWDCEEVREESEETTDFEEQLDIPSKVSTYIGMANLNSHVFAMHLSLVDLTH